MTYNVVILKSNENDVCPTCRLKIKDVTCVVCGKSLFVSKCDVLGGYEENSYPMCDSNVCFNNFIKSKGDTHEK